MDWVTSNSAVKTTINGNPDELVIAARLKHANIVALHSSTTQAIEQVLAANGKAVLPSHAVLADHGLLRQRLPQRGHRQGLVPDPHQQGEKACLSGCSFLVVCTVHGHELLANRASLLEAIKNLSSQTFAVKTRMLQSLDAPASFAICQFALYWLGKYPVVGA